MDVWAVIVAAGRGSRLAEAVGGEAKQFLPWRGRPLFWHSARTLARSPRMSGLVFVFAPDRLEESARLVADLDREESLGVPWKVAPGGERRQDSVRAGLAALPPSCGAVLVHDAARPFASAALTSALLGALDRGEQAAAPGLAVTDTVKLVRDGRAVETLPRDRLRAVQTPQAFVRSVLVRAHEQAEAEGFEATDDASLVERMGLAVAVVPGEEGNVKITKAGDLRLLEGETRTLPCAGFGYDVHRYGPGRPMVLGGTPIPGGPEVVAHSDGDVLLHALTDAILGCCGGGDIGEHFPDTDGRYANMASGVFVREALELARRSGVEIVQADLTVVAQTPRLSPHKALIRRSVAGLLELPEAMVNVKATTEEGLGFTGEKRGIKAVAVVAGLRKVGP